MSRASRSNTNPDELICRCGWFGDRFDCDETQEIIRGEWQKQRRCPRCGSVLEEGEGD